MECSRKLLPAFTSALIFIAVLISTAGARPHAMDSSSSAPSTTRSSSGSRSLLQAAAITYNPSNKSVEVQKVFSTLNASQMNEPDVLYTDANGNVNWVVQTAQAAYPNPETENPEGWRFKTLANNTMIVATATPELVGVRNSARADSKLAPAVALAATNVLASNRVLAGTDAVATGRPGLHYGAVVANADQFIRSTKEGIDVNFDMVGSTTQARATAGQGQTVSFARNDVNIQAGGALSDVRSSANSARWYMAPGHAISGAVNIGHGGRLYLYTNNRARSSLGTATGGVLNYGWSIGILPVRFFGKIAKSGAAIVSEIDQKVDNDAGNAAAGYLNVQRIFNGGMKARNYPGAVASTAVGNAVAGGLTFLYSESGPISIGDYDDELDTPENDVAATSRGRGTAEAGQVNLAISPNSAAQILGDVKATAAQGSAVAGGFSIINGYDGGAIGVDVNAATSEYDAVAGNVAVAQGATRNVIATSAAAKTTTGSALAYNIANAAVAQQNSAVGSAKATTRTGQAASLAVAPSVGGVHSESQGAASSTTASGNALSIGASFSGSALTSRGVATSAAATEEGQALSSGWTAAVSGDTVADVAASAATLVGNAAAVGQGYSLGVLNGRATVASAAGTQSGSAGSLAAGVATGIIQAQGAAASKAETKDGRANSLAIGLAAAGINSVSKATSSAASETGDVTSSAFSGAVGVLHGEAAATSTSGTGCVDCVSDSVANAVATGIVADALARAAADSPKNPGNALSNAMAFGMVSRTSNGGSARVAVGPAQALAGGFAVSGGGANIQRQLPTGTSTTPTAQR